MGKSVAIELAQKGANIVIVSRTVEKLQSALEDIKVWSQPTMPTACCLHPDIG